MKHILNRRVRLERTPPTLLIVSKRGDFGHVLAPNLPPHCSHDLFARARLDDFIYERKPTDEIFDYIEDYTGTGEDPEGQAANA